MLDLLESKVQLHERIEIFYTVDGYIAAFLDQDGDKLICHAKGATILEALLQLQDHELVRNWK